MDVNFKNKIQENYNIDSINIVQNPYDNLINNMIEVDEYIINNKKYYISRDKIVYKCIDDKLGLIIGKRIGTYCKKIITLD